LRKFELAGAAEIENLKFSVLGERPSTPAGGMSTRAAESHALSPEPCRRNHMNHSPAFRKVVKSLYADVDRAGA
jgi:hypothetical protein